jgi:hypothetical protein
MGVDGSALMDVHDINYNTYESKPRTGFAPATDKLVEDEDELKARLQQDS